jgi:signal transduction histidine kinase
LSLFRAFYTLVLLIFTSIGILLFQDIILSKEGESVDNYTADVQKRLEIMINDIKAYHRSLQGTYLNETQANLFTEQKLYENKWPLLIAKDERLIFWSSQKDVFDYSFLSDIDDVGFLELSFGDYLVIETTDESLTFISLVPLSKNYAIDNEYLKDEINNDLLGFWIRDITGGERGEPVYYHEKELFKVITSENIRYYSSNDFHRTLIYFHLGCIFLLFLLLFLPDQFTLRFVLVFTLVLAIVRSIHLYFSVFSSHFEKARNIWDPRIYASSIWSPTLGDYFLNHLFFFLGIFVLLRYISDSRTFHLWRKNSYYSTFILLGLSALGHGFLFMLYRTALSVYYNSSISLDISKAVDVNMAMLMVYFIIVVAGFLLFFCNHLLLGYFQLFGNRKKNIVGLFILNVVALVLAFVVGGYTLTILIAINLAFLIISFQLRLYKSVSSLKFSTTFYFLLGIVSFSIIFATVVYQGEQKRTLSRLMRQASQLLVERDNLAEYSLDRIRTEIQADPFITNKFLNPFSNRKAVVDKIKKVYMSGYLSKYKVSVFLFDAQDNPLGEFGERDYEYFDQIRTRSNETTTPGLFLLDQRNLKYALFISFSRYGYPVGKMVLLLESKRIAPQTVYPDLLAATGEKLRFSREFEYAIFNENDILYSTSNFDEKLVVEFNYELSEPEIYDGKVIWGEANSSINRSVVIYGPTYEWVRFATNFSLAFLTVILLAVVVAMTNFLVYRLVGRPSSLSAKIQLALSFAFFIPLVALSFTLYSLVIDQSKQSIIEDYKTKIQGVSSSIFEQVKDFNGGIISREELNNRLSDYANAIQEDLNLFNKYGYLISSSQPEVFTNHLLPNYANPIALSSIYSSTQRKPVIVGERVGQLSFRSSYMPVIDDDGSILGFMSMPFFGYRVEKDLKIIEILSSILNSFTVIFLFTYGIIFLFSTLLTRPLQNLANTIRKTNFLQRNEPIPWAVRDEIGRLIFAYNEMIQKLERSKEELSAQEKEAAWREMAKQVAHEIKNPLTPMKLNLQYLLTKNKKDTTEDARQQKETLRTIIEQVDSLSDIATSFSAFAKMPLPNPSRFDLAKLLKRIADLYKDQKPKVVLQSTEELFTFGDEKLLGRIFQNIILNAIQASNSEGTIHVKLAQSGNENLLVTIKDQGKGIPEELQETIFQPNFTTKSTGSGIGLAIAKRGIEFAGGRIWFESQMNRGTTFFIELPRS